MTIVLVDKRKFFLWKIKKVSFDNVLFTFIKQSVEHIL